MKAVSGNNVSVVAFEHTWLAHEVVVQVSGVCDTPLWD